MTLWKVGDFCSFVASTVFVAQDGCSIGDDDVAAAADHDGGDDDDDLGADGSTVVEPSDVAVDRLEGLSKRSIRQIPGKQTTE